MRLLLLALPFLLLACGSDTTEREADLSGFDGRETPTEAASISADGEALVGVWQLVGKRGTWEGAEIDEAYGINTWTFRPDGSGMSAKIFPDNDMAVTDDYRWALDGATLTLRHPTMDVEPTVYEITEHESGMLKWFDEGSERFFVLERGGE